MDASRLVSRTCEPCRGGTPGLSEPQARGFLEQTPEWALQDNASRLMRRFEFENFKSGLEFVNRVGDLAEEQGHHPDIAIHWNKVELVLWTHAIGGLHENDFILAAKIDRLLEEPRRATSGLAG